MSDGMRYLQIQPAEMMPFQMSFISQPNVSFSDSSCPTMWFIYLTGVCSL